MSYVFQGESCSIVHDGGYDGNVQIVGITGQSVVVAADDLLEFAAEYCRRELIGKLENAPWRDVLLRRQ